MSPSRTPEELNGGDSGGALSQAEAIEAEFADHLAASARQLAAEGVEPETAARIAQDRFGDARRIARRCLWIQTGDEIMFRTISIGLLSLLALGLIFVAASGWHSQRTLSDRLGELSEQLGALHSTSEPPEVTGLLYRGDRAHPAADAVVELYRWEPGEDADWRIVRRLRSDANGQYRTGPLTQGDYCLQSDVVLEGESENQRRVKVQSEPIYVVENAKLNPIDLDLTRPVGYVRLRLSNPLPEPIEVAGHSLRVDVAWQMHGVNNYMPIKPTYGTPPSKWPLYGYRNSLVSSYSKQTTILTPDKSLYLQSNTLEPTEQPLGFLTGDYMIFGMIRATWNGVPEAYSEQLRIGFGGDPLQFSIRAGETVSLIVDIPDTLGAEMASVVPKGSDNRAMAHYITKDLNQPLTIRIDPAPPEG